MTGLRRVACLIGSAAALVLSASGCTDYTYFNVHVTIDPAIDDNASIARREIDSCVVYVLAGDKQIEGWPLTNLDGNPACSRDKTPLDVGTMDYSTARTSGTLTFIVDMLDLDRAVTVQGSEPADIKVGRVLSVNLIAKTCHTKCDQDPKTCPINTCGFVMSGSRP